MARKPRGTDFTFGLVDIPIGAVLHFKYPEVLRGAIVKVAGHGLEVTCDGEPYSLGDLTRKLIKARDSSASTNLQPIQKWRYNGRRLDEIYEEWKWKRRLGRG